MVLPANLPKSKAKGLGPPPSATRASEQTVARPTTNNDRQSDENANFIHPPHVIPPPSYPHAQDLIIVCCHAIFLPNAHDPAFPLYSPHHEPNWLLAPFQKSNEATGKLGEHETFLAHVRAGIDAVSVGTGADHAPSSLLVLSGGATKRSETLKSEARSYFDAVLADELAEGHLNGGRAHRLFKQGYILLEEQATDSFQNLLFSILLFRKATGKYPERIRIITHAFKAKRFLELHAPAIRWPKDRVQVQGIDPVMSNAELESTLHGEAQNGFAVWENDPMGTGDFLDGKRKLRGWDASKSAELFQDLEESVKELFQGKASGQLPWIA